MGGGERDRLCVDMVVGMPNVKSRYWRLGRGSQADADEFWIEHDLGEKPDLHLALADAKVGIGVTVSGTLDQFAVKARFDRTIKSEQLESVRKSMKNKGYIEKAQITST